MTFPRPIALLASCALAVTTPAPSGAALDHFLTYRIKDSRGSICAADASQNVGGICTLETECGGIEEETAVCAPKGFPKGRRASLATRFETATFDVLKPITLGEPASPNGQAIADPQTHLKAYQIALAKMVPRQRPHAKRTNLLVRNVFHAAGSEIALDTQKPDRLLVPTARSLTGPVAPPNPATHSVDHYACYTVKPSKNTPRFVVIPDVSVAGPLATPARRYDLKKPSRLCVPTTATIVPGGTVEPIDDPNASLLCYQAALRRTVPRQAKHQPVVGIFLANRFGPERVDTMREDELCVPSLLLPPIGCPPETTRACYDGPAGTQDVGVCRAGMQTCATDGTFGPCTGQVLPMIDIPGNGVDEDCDGADQPGGGDPIPPSTVTVDETVRVEVTEVEGLDGAPARPVTALTDRSGIPMHFVENELIVVTDKAGEAAALAQRWGGSLVKSLVPANAGLAGVSAQHLVRVAPSSADVPQLVADLQAIEEGTRSDLRVASEAGLRLLAAAARETAMGNMAVLNVVMQPQGFEERTTTENTALGLCPQATCPGGIPPVPSIPPVAGCVCPGIAVPMMSSETFNTNAFAWSYMMAGGPQNIGVGEAWRALSLAGLLGNQVTIAAIDRGFSNLATDNPTFTAYLNAVNPLEPNVYPANTGSCGGASCPWHGAGVVSAAMGPADDGKGAAGPAGPIAKAVTIRHGGDQFTISLGVIANVAGPARIINMSFGQRHPATLSWMAGPSNLLTLALNGAGKLVVAAAGNDNADVDSEDCVPTPPFGEVCWEDAWWTPCENGGVFCVGALAGNATTRASYSNWGNEEVDLFGPGTVWVGGDPSDPEPHAVSGTSVASPFVAGVAALVMAAKPQLTNDEVEQALIQTALPSGDGNVRRYVNAQAAVNLALGGSPICTPPRILSITPTHTTAPCVENVFEVTHSQTFGPFRYQWKKVVPGTTTLVDVPEGDNVSGTTTDRMTIDPFRPADAGRYAVVVSNICGSTTSGFIRVTTVDGRVERAPSLIEARSHVGMAFDRGRGRMVLFGGLKPPFQTSNDTWERDGNGAWQFVTDQGPAPRFFTFMAYDEARSVSVLYGGDALDAQGRPFHLSDTWEWNGTTWTQRPAAGIGSLTFEMTYDPVRQRVVRYDDDYVFYEWDGTAWTPRGTPPDPLNGKPTSTTSAVAFDRNRNVYVVREGDRRTWEVDATGQWLLKEPAPLGEQGPRNFDRGSMVFDSTRGRTLLYSVNLAVQPSPFFWEGTLWEWTGATWVRKPTALLPQVEHKAFMAYDSLRQRTLITGVYGFFQGTVTPVDDAFEWRFFADDPTCSLGPP